MAKKDIKNKEEVKVEKGQVQVIEDELFQLMLDNKRNKLKNTTAIARKRDEIARLLTKMREKELQKNG